MNFLSSNHSWKNSAGKCYQNYLSQKNGPLVYFKKCALPANSLSSLRSALSHSDARIVSLTSTLMATTSTSMFTWNGRLWSNTLQPISIQHRAHKQIQMSLPLINIATSFSTCSRFTHQSKPSSIINSSDNITIITINIDKRSHSFDEFQAKKRSV